MLQGALPKLKLMIFLEQKTLATTSDLCQICYHSYWGCIDVLGNLLQPGYISDRGIDRLPLWWSLCHCMAIRNGGADWGGRGGIYLITSRKLTQYLQNTMYYKHLGWKITCFLSFPSRIVNVSFLLLCVNKKMSVHLTDSSFCDIDSCRAVALYFIHWKAEGIGNES